MTYIDTKIDNYVIFASLNSESTCKQINRQQGSRLLISGLPGSPWKMHVESLGKPRDSTSILKALPGKLDIKRHSPSILYLLLVPLYVCFLYLVLVKDNIYCVFKSFK